MKLSNTLVIATALVSTFIACSRQGEGERCITANGDADCESGLVCTPSQELRLTNEFKPADRCCPPTDGPKYTDPRCEPRGNDANGSGGSTNSTNSTNSNGNSTTTPEAAGAGAGGASEAIGGAPAAAGGGA